MKKILSAFAVLAVLSAAPALAAPPSHDTYSASLTGGASSGYNQTEAQQIRNR